MSFNKYTRKVTWLIPGLSIKRWIGISVLGGFVLLLGLALLSNLQPITQLINLLKELALILPNTLTGSLVVILGLLLMYLGASKTFQTFETAVGVNDESLREALYKRWKLSNGPRVVAIGGGTGLSTLLRGVKLHTSNITAVVTVGDDGGSSGRLRKEQGIIPPGDIRNCIAALADEEKLITELFQYRFQTGHGLEGHSFGNLFLTALCRITGDMMSAIKESSSVLNIRGRVLPSTLDSVALSAVMEDGAVVHGESDIPKAKGKIQRVFCTPERPTPLVDVIAAIEDAELIILGPGSLYTSVIPNLLIPEIAQAVARSKAPKVYVVNIMTQPGETDGYSVADHVEAIHRHAGFALVDVVFVNSWLPDILLQRYREVDCVPVELDSKRLAEMNVEVVQKILVNEQEAKTIRHNPRRLARVIIKWFKHGARKKIHRSLSLTREMPAYVEGFSVEPCVENNPVTAS